MNVIMLEMVIAVVIAMMLMLDPAVNLMPEVNVVGKLNLLALAMIVAMIAAIVGRWEEEDTKTQLAGRFRQRPPDRIVPKTSLFACRQKPS